jgi:hypothetical protein
MYLKVKNKKTEKILYLTQIQKQYGDYLDRFNWNFFQTLSTPYALSKEAARRAIERYKNIIENSIGKTIIFFASEPFDLKEGFHLHCLLKIDNINLSSYLLKKKLIEKWQIVTGTSNIKGESARIHFKNYIKGKGAHYYVGKYIHRRNADYDLLV